MTSLQSGRGAVSGPFRVPDGRAWAKLGEAVDGGPPPGWHSLPGHSIDVAAVFRALLDARSIRGRLEALAGRALATRDLDRLAALAFLHDLGKANAGFRSRCLSDLERTKIGLGGGTHYGHLREVGGLICTDLFARADERLGLAQILQWCGGEDALGEYLGAMLGHHGRPLNAVEFVEGARNHRRLWAAQTDYDPIAALAELGDALREALPGAFAPGGSPLPNQPEFIHAFGGLLQLADWIGSDEARFRFDQGKWLARWPKSLELARSTLAEIGLTAIEAASKEAPFGTLFLGREGAPLTPSDLQREAGLLNRGRIVLIESETGSGKTEAALWRFAALVAAGETDSLYFALPTRVSATMMYERVRAFAQRLFGVESPGVVLAVPGQVKLDGQDLAPLPDEPVKWTEDAGDAAAPSRWAAERPKRFLAARIAVGTVDQALLSALQAKHAHLRHACLMRSLLVVDEVHASDTYMTRVLEQLLANHTRAGGHALLMSATLGASARARLHAPKCGAKTEALEAAIASHYPAVSWTGGRADVAPTGRAKSVAVQVEPSIDAPDKIAEFVADAIEAGAKALVIRNAVGAAQATQAAIEARLGPDHPALFWCKGVVSLNHGRFARDDRKLLDEAVEAALGKARPDGPAVVVGTQTLEQSLDIDADVLVTDLCPVDVLLQRIGRLYRHDRNKRPPGFEEARVCVLVPENPDLLASRGKHGLGLSPRWGVGVYENLLAIEATRRLMAEHPVWEIPAMNRALVERATHPEALAALHEELRETNAEWDKVGDQIFGKRFAHEGAAKDAELDTAKRFTEVVFPDAEEAILTRLGANDRRLILPAPMISPFGQTIEELTVPGFWGLAIPDDGRADEARAVEGGFEVRVGATWFTYDRWGLRKMT